MLDIAVLGLLDIEPMHGYQIRKVLTEMSGTVFSFPQVVRGDGAAGGDAVGASQNTIRSGKNNPKANIHYIEPIYPRQ